MYYIKGNENMSKKNKQEWISFIENGQRWMICKVCQSEYVEVDEKTAAISCSQCVLKKKQKGPAIQNLFVMKTTYNLLMIFLLRNIRRLVDQLDGIGWRSLLTKMVMCFTKVKNNLN